jgi:hypothetical protein
MKPNLSKAKTNLSNLPNFSVFSKPKPKPKTKAASSI